MMSHWFGWIATGFGVFAFFTYILRSWRCRNQKLQHLFRGKHHHIWGELMLVIGALHGLLAIAFGRHGQAGRLFSGISVLGLLSWIVALLLKVTADKPQRFGNKWLHYHRMLAIALIPLLLLHIIF